ncbi:MAG TPA: filamentous hemagglutinin N-terminal domain-containing protein, partial [Burkholderiales bacterium]|nr:filamentous hemagglutinin N-terminal domain-containing protein [Burkholderiales bacterium]
MASRGQKSYRRKLVALAVASCFATELSYAQGVGGTVVRGNATIVNQGNTQTITNTPGTVINWQGFSIPSQNIVQFIQQSAASAVLNRVTGATQSTILGTLQSNGRVYLINPNGITIGAGAVIDVAGFVASSLNLSDADFAAGRLRFTETPGAGAVINRGEIKTASGGMVYLVGQNIENHGVIKSPQGEIILAAGKSIELVDAGTPEIRVQITAPDNQALNLGQLLASGGRIGMYAGLVRHGGTANANTAIVGENGKIVFKATKSVTLEAGSVTTASGPTAGSVKVEAETGTAVVAGLVEADATAGRGGNIEISGQQGVTLESTGRLSANGVDGGTVALSSTGGPVRVAGQISADASAGRGGQVAIAAATQTSIATSARVTANGTQGGGSVSVAGNEGVVLETGSAVQANGAAGGVVIVDATQGSVDINGAIEATGSAADGGIIRIAALTGVTLGDSGVLSVIGNHGGEVRVEAWDGTTLVSGLINAFGGDGQGGKVLLLGSRVGLLRNAFVNVSGRKGGGIALVGGDFHGDNPDVPNAERTYIGPETRITADALETGDGGKVVIWSDEITRFYGAITARGGANGGNGGFAEVSGKEFLVYRGTADLRAPAGSFGTLLLDPRDITIQASGSNNSELNAGVPIGEIDGQILFGAATTTDFTLTAATVSGTTSANLVLQA